MRPAASIAAVTAFFFALVHRLRAEPADDNGMAFVKAAGDTASPFAANEGLMLLIGAGAVLTVIVALLLVVYRLNRKTVEALDEIEARLDTLEGSDG